MEKNKGTLLRGSKKEPQADAPQTLADLGIEKKTSMMAQQVANLSPAKFEALKETAGSVAGATGQAEVDKSGRLARIGKDVL